MKVQPLNPANGEKKTPPVVIPTNVWLLLQQFLLDKKTGSIQLNVQNGRVLGVHLKEMVQSTID